MKAIVFGAGGHARVVLAMLAASRDYTVTGVVDIGTPRPDETIFGVPVIGGADRLLALRKTGVEAAFVALGSGEARSAAQAKLAAAGFALPPLVHPSAFVDPTARLGAGVQICAMAYVGPDVIIGDGVIINTHAAVDHETRVGNFVTLSPAVTVAGRCVIGDGAFLGIGAKLSDGLVLGAGSKLGAGAVALSNVMPGKLVVGIPARPKQ